MSSLQNVRENILANTEVNPVPGGTSYTRGRWLNLDNAGGIKSAEFPEGAGIVELVFFAKPAVGSTLSGDEYVIIGLDPANAALASLFLTQAESLSSDIQWIPIPLDQLVRVPLKAALSEGSLNGGTIPAKTVGGVAIDLWIGGSK